MKTTIEKQVVLDGSYGISKPRPKGIQNHVIEVWHVIKDGKNTGTYGTRHEARNARRK